MKIAFFLSPNNFLRKWINIFFDSKNTDTTDFITGKFSEVKKLLPKYDFIILSSAFLNVYGKKAKKFIYANASKIGVYFFDPVSCNKYKIILEELFKHIKFKFSYNLSDAKKYDMFYLPYPMPINFINAPVQKKYHLSCFFGWNNYRRNNMMLLLKRIENQVSVIWNNKHDRKKHKCCVFESSYRGHDRYRKSYIKNRKSKIINSNCTCSFKSRDECNYVTISTIDSIFNNTKVITDMNAIKFHPAYDPNLVRIINIKKITDNDIKFIKSPPIYFKRPTKKQLYGVTSEFFCEKLQKFILEKKSNNN